MSGDGGSSWRVGVAAVAGLVAMVAALVLSERCEGDPRFACESAAGIGGAALWLVAIVLLAGVLVHRVRSRWAIALAIVVVLITVVTLRSIDQDNETVVIVVVAGAALSLGVLLGLWGLLLEPLFVLAAVPFSHADDADNVSPWVYAAIDSTFLIVPALLVGGGVGFGVSLLRARRETTRANAG